MALLNQKTSLKGEANNLQVPTGTCKTLTLPPDLLWGVGIMWSRAMGVWSVGFFLAGNLCIPVDPLHSWCALSHNITSSEAVSFQVQKCLKHDLLKVLPLLHGISSVLDNVNLHSEDLVEFWDPVTAIGTQLTIGSGESSAPMIIEQQWPLKKTIIEGISQRHILPPSPEWNRSTKSLTVFSKMYLHYID